VCVLEGRGGGSPFCLSDWDSGDADDVAAPP